MTKSTKKKEGFTLEISPKIAEILGVHKPDDVRIIVIDNQVILQPKKVDPAHIKKLKEERAKVSKRLMKQYAPVLEKLAKT